MRDPVLWVIALVGIGYPLAFLIGMFVGAWAERLDMQDESDKKSFEEKLQ